MIGGWDWLGAVAIENVMLPVLALTFRATVPRFLAPYTLFRRRVLAIDAGPAHVSGCREQVVSDDRLP